ncbi:AbrB family transcriptional regulator [Tolypothrix sp. PCC 7601]|nr:AbrB family transcriptional regulator [Tolypothrix sp. PCC 7601]BAY88565.1 transcriptional regulator AbrB [Microchaete diplosiphon NIES-3275]
MLAQDNIVYQFGESKEILSIMTETATAPLTGKALLAKVKELSNLPRRERAKQCGYYTVTKNNQVRVNLTDFYDALLSARGIPLSPEAPKDGRGREPTYRVSVHQNGQIVIGATYTKAMGLKPGDEFEIRLGYKHIHLIQLGETDKKLTQSDLDVDDLDEEDLEDEDEE